MPGPATESGETPRRPVDIVALVGNLNVERFKAGKIYKKVICNKLRRGLKTNIKENV